MGAGLPLGVLENNPFNAYGLLHDKHGIERAAVRVPYTGGGRGDPKLHARVYGEAEPQVSAKTDV